MGRNLSAIAHEVQWKCIIRFFLLSLLDMYLSLMLTYTFQIFIRCLTCQKSKKMYFPPPSLPVLLFKRRHIEMIELTNDGKGLGFGIVGGRSTGVMVKTILPGGAAGQVNTLTCKTRQTKHVLTRLVKIDQHYYYLEIKKNVLTYLLSQNEQ